MHKMTQWYSRQKRRTMEKCNYCISKGWKGLNYIESECYTKKHEKAKAKAAEA